MIDNTAKTETAAATPTIVESPDSSPELCGVGVVRLASTPHKNLDAVEGPLSHHGFPVKSL